MNELQVKTIELKPAIIQFNHVEIEKELRKNLAKYEGLTFTSDATTEIRSTLAELRKGKKAVDDYRKEVKKELNEPVKAFEDQCKALNTYFDNVITPLDDQLKIFTERERAEKLDKLLIAKDEYIQKHELGGEYVDRIEMEDQYLNKSMSLKMASEAIEFQVKNLKMEQDRLESDKKVIIKSIELANERNDLGFSADAYIRLLEFDDLGTVHGQLNKDIDKELERRTEKKRQEELRKEQEEQDRIENERKLEQEKEEQEQAEKFNEQMEAITEAVADDPEPVPSDPFLNMNEMGQPTSVEVPFMDMDDPFADDEPTLMKNYEVIGTAEELEQLEQAMNQIGLEWTVIE